MMAKAHGPRIKAARGYAGGISTAELATRLGVSDSTVKRWEKGDPSLTPGYRLAIASVCGVPPKFIENGWGILEPSQVEELLAQQSAILQEIKDAIEEQKTLKSETDGILPAIRDLLQGAPEAAEVPPGVRPQRASAET
jgi:transcriptional regulator with XRE-family HTH domain